MSSPQSGVPLFDPGNPLVQAVPSMVTYGVIDTPQGQRLVMTYRTPDTTFSLVVDKKTARSWHQMMGDQIEQMSSLDIAPAGAVLPPMRPGL